MAIRLLLAVVALLSLAACTGSPATLALRPAFEVATPDGVASVSIREAPAGMTGSEFLRLVEAGMTRGASAAVIAEPVDAPFPARRIVWHASPGSGRGVSTLTVNIFDGARPIAYEQERIANDAQPAAVEAAIGSLTTRLIAALPSREMSAPVREALSRK
ncbi:MAG TPA: hypothetical protein VMU85_00455 [Stellaceae bacterium]|nr:hypothetical protein [Stellaceae bacterium]